jgi:DNA-binding HxlR family transcriptional regulator
MGRELEIDYEFFYFLRRKWSIPIILTLERTHTIRISELKKLFPNSTEKMLIETLELLLKNKIIKKKEYEVYPKHTEYKLTSYGVVISEILKEIQNRYNEYKDII